MNLKKRNFVLVTLLFIIVSLLIVSVTAKLKGKKNQNVQVSMKTLKPSYVLGEVVEFQVKIKNLSSDKILHRGLSLASSSLILYIASEDGVYKKHNYYQTKDIAGILRAGKTFTFNESVLWNGVPNFADKRLLPKDIVKDNYLFSKPGIYYLKLNLVLPQEGGTSLAESDPITLIINQPIGEDAKVWNALKNRSDLGLFIQSGGGAIKKQKKSNKLLSEVESLISKYPNSVYANKLRDSKVRFLETKEKIRKSEALKEERERKLREKLRKGEPLVPETIDNF